MKRVYNTGSYLKLSLCMLSLTGFSGDLSARIFMPHGEEVLGKVASFGKSALRYSKDFSGSAVSYLKRAAPSSEQRAKVKKSCGLFRRKN
ncbi:MAG: hypothetical protein ACRC4G_06840 [Alphaproteobacteria bacterium]